MKRILVLAVLALGLGRTAEGEIVERRALDNGGSTVSNWEEGYFEVTGYATADPDPNRVKMRLKSLAAAKVLAQVALVELLQGVRVTSLMTVSDMVLEESIQAARVEGVSKGAVTIAEEVVWERMSDGSEIPQASVTLRVCLRDRSPACTQYGGGGRGVLRSMRLDQVEIPSEVPSYNPSRTELQQARDVLDTEEPEEKYNSLIVRTGGNFFQPVLYPEIITEEGTAVYGPDVIESGALLRNGPAQFSNDLDRAKEIPLLEKEPLVVTVLAVDENDRLVVSKEDAAKIMAASAKNGNFLKEAKVAIVLD